MMAQSQYERVMKKVLKVGKFYEMKVLTDNFWIPNLLYWLSTRY